MQDKFKHTSHKVGRKKVLISNDETESCLTQFAYGELDSGDKIETHVHPTMDEYFYFIDGEGKYRIGEQSYNVFGGCHITIPANKSHSLESTGNDTLKFVYLGIALNRKE